MVYFLAPMMEGKEQSSSWKQWEGEFIWIGKWQFVGELMAMWRQLPSRQMLLGAEAQNSRNTRLTVGVSNTARIWMMPGYHSELEDCQGGQSPQKWREQGTTRTWQAPQSRGRGEAKVLLTVLARVVPVKVGTEVRALRWILGAQKSLLKAKGETQRLLATYISPTSWDLVSYLCPPEVRNVRCHLSKPHY